MPVRERLLRSKDGPNFKDPAEVCGDCHLLVQLGGLRQAGGLAQVLQVEHRGAPLAASGDELRGVDLDEALGEEELAKELHPRRD